ncbi:MAG: hypothetical protein V9H69_25940 [Anaerolineae bacterium]
MATRWLKLQRTERPLLLASLVWLGVSAVVLVMVWAALRWAVGARPAEPLPTPVLVASRPAMVSPSIEASNGDLVAAMLQEATPESEVLTPAALSLPSADELALPSAPPSPLQILLDVPRRPQERNLNCEFRSATDLASYFGWAFTWEQLFEVVGANSGGDPNLGFVGRSMNDPVGGLYPSGYGVYAEPLAQGLRRLGVPATAHQRPGRGMAQGTVGRRPAGGDLGDLWLTAAADRGVAERGRRHRARCPLRAYLRGRGL